MNLFDFVRSRREPEKEIKNRVDHASPIHFDGGHGDAAEELNFMSAISAHIAWRGRLESYFNGTNKEHLPPSDVYASCSLGDWIHGTGRQKYGHMEEFQDLEALHERFHSNAQMIVKYILNGKHVEASQLFSGDYSVTSRRVVARLAYLHQLLGS